MNLINRIDRLEQNQPTKDTREPLLVEFIGDDDNETRDNIAGILYTYDGNEPKQLTRKELEAIQ